MRITNGLATGAALLVVVSTAAEAVQSGRPNETATSSLSTPFREPVPNFGPAPSWARQETVQATDQAEEDQPFRFLLISSQDRVTASGIETYAEYVVQPLNQAGLQAVGTVMIPWKVDRAGLTLNKVGIERDGKLIDALRHQDVSVIRRESALEKSIITGIRTVLLPVRGLQVGDKLHVAWTYDEATTLGKTEEIQSFTVPFPVSRVVRRFLVDKELPVRWAVDPSIKEASASATAKEIERVFVLENVEPPEERSFVPTRFKSKLVQLSAFENWTDVAVPLIPLFDAARDLPQDSPVKALADKIAAEHSDPRARMLAASRAAQDEIRYVALLLGDGNYKPMSADEVWARRFGDCKGKTAFLLALLDRLGIPAEPMLVSVQLDDALERRLPSLAIFDHVLVRAHVAGETYYLDGTNYGQRTLEELKASPTRHGLPLVRDASLVTTPDVIPSMPLEESVLVWNASENVTGDVPFEATLILRGYAAAVMRQKTVSSTDRGELDESLKSKVPRVPNDALEIVSSEPEAADGSYVVRFKGSAEIDWSPVEGMKGNRMALSQSTVTWDGEFDRDEGEGKDIPVLMAFPYWERSVEKVILPNGGKDFRLEAEPIDRTIAATHLTRKITMANGVITAVSDFKSLHRELPAEAARSAKAELEQVAENYAYIVSKRKLKLPD